MIENDTWYRCNVCGQEGRVGRCCSDEDRTPLNALAKAEQERIKGAKNTEQAREIILNTCPFCGSTKTELMFNHAYFVECMECGSQGPWKNYASEAQKLWNTRAGA